MMQRIPVMNTQVFGRSSILPVMVAQRTRLAQAPPGPVIAEAQINVQKAKTHYDGVLKTYDNLVDLMGKEKADEAVEQAGAAYQKALDVFSQGRPK